MGFFFRLLAGCLGKLARDDRGQATTEYILILSMAVLGAGALSRALISGLDAGLTRLGAALEQDLKTGRLPANVWQN